MSCVADYMNKPLSEIAQDANLRQGLVSLYSKLFEGGRPCRSCDSALYGYYTKLRQMGAKREMLLQLAKQRTCKPKFKGLRWIAKISSHIDTDVLHDEQAIQLLKAGALSQSDFEVLPAGYLATVHVDTSTAEQEPELEHSRTFADELLAHEQQLEELAEKPKRGRKAKQ